MKFLLERLNIWPLHTESGHCTYYNDFEYPVLVEWANFYVRKDRWTSRQTNKIDHRGGFGPENRTQLTNISNEKAFPSAWFIMRVNRWLNTIQSMPIRIINSTNWYAFQALISYFALMPDSSLRSQSQRMITYVGLKNGSIRYKNVVTNFVENKKVLLLNLLKCICIIKLLFTF